MINKKVSEINWWREEKDQWVEVGVELTQVDNHYQKIRKLFQINKVVW